MVKTTTASLVVFLSLVSQFAAAETVLLDFSSRFCEPCRRMAPIVHQLKAAGYPVRQVDVASDAELASRFGISKVPCFVMVVDGREVDRDLGEVTYQRLEQMLRRAGASSGQSRPRTQSPDSSLGGSPWASVNTTTPSLYARNQSPVDNPKPPSQTWPSERPSSGGPPAWTGLVAASVRLKVEDDHGNSRGTGTIVDARSGEALVITCGHLFRDSEGRGPVSVELFEMTGTGPRVVAQVPGQVIGYDLDRDIGLVSIRPNRPVRVAPIAASPAAIQRGERVASVGCDHADDPTLIPTWVTAIDRYQGAPNIEASGAPVEGRSGGGLFNEQGELIGVCFAADPEGNEGLYTGLTAIHALLDEKGLSEIHSSRARAPEANVVAEVPRDMNPLVVRGQDPQQPQHPLQPVAFAQEVPRQPVRPTNPMVPAAGLEKPRPELSGPEQAAFGEIMRRAAEAEVICIIRPKDPGGASEVITLDHVSPEFVRALAEHRTTGDTTSESGAERVTTSIWPERR